MKSRRYGWLIAVVLCIAMTFGGAQAATKATPKAVVSREVLGDMIAKAILQCEPSVHAIVQDQDAWSVVEDLAGLYGVGVRSQGQWTRDDALDSTFTFQYHSGERIWYALKNDKTNGLDGRDKATFERAQRIVEAHIDKSLTPYERALGVHDYLTRSVSYSTKDPDSTQDAYGALVQRVAACSGYADAFFLLCNMVDVPVRKVQGVADGVPHEWNLIRLDDLWYAVDVTWDDPVGEAGQPTHMYFGIPIKILAATHTWDARQDQKKMATKLDGNNYYVAKGWYIKSKLDFSKSILQNWNGKDELTFLSDMELNMGSVMEQIGERAEELGVKASGIQYSTNALGDLMWYLIRVKE